MALPGTMILEARRHFLDFVDMPSDELGTIGSAISLLSGAIKRTTGAERVYLLSTMAGVPHFHAWLIPWTAGTELKGPAFVAEKHSCTEKEAFEAATRLRAEIVQASR